MTLCIWAFTPEEGRLAATWRYEPPFDIYNGDPDDAEMFLRWTEEGYGYYAVVDEDEGQELVGYC